MAKHKFVSYREASYNFYNFCSKITIINASNKEFDCFVKMTPYGGCTYSIEELNVLKSQIENSIKYHDTLTVVVKNIQEKEKERQMQSMRNQPKAKKQHRSGHVYLAVCELKNMYKIGFTSKNVNNRITQLKNSNPAIKLFKSYPVVTYKIEKELHSHFQEKKFSGEWFSFDENDLELVEFFINQMNENYAV